MKKINNWLWQDLPETTSTNDAVRDFIKMYGTPCVVTAQKQTAGRGRRGRTWIGMEGNLFMSFAFNAEPDDLGQLSILSGLAVWHTVFRFCPLIDISIKWPNDVLVNGAKISGILFEHAGQNIWIMGIGINVAAAPAVDADYTTTSLRDLGVVTDRIDVFTTFIEQFDTLYNIWCDKGFTELKQSWLDKAYKCGKKITVKQEKREINGIFKSIDNDGSLIMSVEGREEKVLVGDMYVGKGKNNDK